MMVKPKYNAAEGYHFLMYWHIGGLQIDASASVNVCPVTIFLWYWLGLWREMKSAPKSKRKVFETVSRTSLASGEVLGAFCPFLNQEAWF